MGDTEVSEAGRTFEVSPEAMLPVLVGVDGVVSVSPPEERLLETVYFDTPDLALARRGVGLQRRTGGVDAGWYVERSDNRDMGAEPHRPLGERDAEVPDDVIAPVRAFVRDRSLVPIVRVSTRRLEQRVVGHDGALLAGLSDDRVRAERIAGPGATEDWREWRITVVDGDRALVDTVSDCLARSGAVVVDGGSTLARVLVEPDRPRKGKKSGRALRRGSASELAIAYLDRHVTALHEQDARVRADAPGAIHKARIATRRLRSALRTYGPLLDDNRAVAVADELRWLGGSLSGARDAQVLRERLGDLVAEQPPELVLGPVWRRIDEELRAEERSGREAALQALESQRYYRLLDQLDDLLTTARFSKRARLPARKVLPRLLRRDAKRLRRAVEAVASAQVPDAHDVALHEARKKAKRLRYAAESMRPALGKRAKKVGGSAKKVQEALGAHQDTVMSRQRLHQYGAHTQANGENGFTFGRLHALEDVRAAAAVLEFQAAWAALSQVLRRLSRDG